MVIKLLAMLVVREYEAVLVLKKLNVQAKEEVLNSIQKIFSKKDISIKDQESWEVQKLFHPVRKEDKGDFQYFLFKAKKGDIPALQSDFKRDLNILRCLIARV